MLISGARSEIFVPPPVASVLQPRRQISVCGVRKAGSQCLAKRHCLPLSMNRCDRKSASADCRPAVERGVQDKLPSASSSGARPKTAGARNWTSTHKRNGEGKFGRFTAAVPANSARSERSGAFDSLLKRAHRRRSSGNTPGSEKTTNKQDARDDDCSRQPGDSNDPSGKCRKQERCAENECGREDAGHDVCWNDEDSATPAAEPVEYTILPRPERQHVSEKQAHPSSSPGTKREDSLCPPRSQDLRHQERTRRNPSVHPAGPCGETTATYGPCSPSSPQEFFPPPEGCHAPRPSPPVRTAPSCSADDKGCSSLGEFAHPGLLRREALPYSPCPSLPLMEASLAPVGVAPPFPCAGYFADNSSRRRTRSYPRRIPERRLYDSHGRWTGQDRRPVQDFTFDEAGWLLNHDQQPLYRDGCFPYFGGRQVAREPRPFADFGRGYSRRHSWSYSSVPDDDIEDLLPLIDKFGIEHESASAESSPEAQIPDEGSWFSVLPETARPEDRFIWSPRRDLHRPQSVWSPIKPRLGGSQQDNFREQLTRAKYRTRTYTGNVLQGSTDAFVEGRRCLSCELPYFGGDDCATGSFKTDDAGWSPWSYQLLTADLLNAP